MKIFFFSFFLAILLVIVIAGPRGRHSPGRPVEIFPDMVRQSKLKPQSPNNFFDDRTNGRLPVTGTVPMGYEIPDAPAYKTIASGNARQTFTGIPAPSFSNSPDYYDTGRMGDAWGTGLPVPVTPALLERGQLRFNINCAVCHGQTGSGNGVTSKYGLSNIANYHDAKYLAMADGEIFNTITNGHNTMMGYGANVDVYDRWAIIAYIRALQRSENVKLAELPAAEQQAIQTPTP
jgi:mono/diheme cytochrome c family protein